MAVISVNIDQKTQKAAETVFAENGLTITEAIKLFFKSTVQEKELPFKILNNNFEKEMDEAMKETENIIKNPHLYKSYTLEDIKNGNYRK
jgi:addiction module RelB/DinJ family antitoxin